LLQLFATKVIKVVVFSKFDQWSNLLKTTFYNYSLIICWW